MMEQRTFAIVGDSRGIGASLREQLLASGHRVIGVSRTGVQRPADAHSSAYQSLVFDAVRMADVRALSLPTPATDASPLTSPGAYGLFAGLALGVAPAGALIALRSKLMSR